MAVEKTGTAYKCDKCNNEWSYMDTHCPNCGSDEFSETEIHLGDNWREQWEKANADREQLTIPVVSGSAYPTPEYVQMLKPTYKSKSGKVKKCLEINNNRRNGWFAPAKDLP